MTPPVEIRQLPLLAQTPYTLGTDATCCCKLDAFTTTPPEEWITHVLASKLKPSRRIRLYVYTLL